MKRIAITGSSGYCGQSLVRYLREVAPHLEILGIDVAPPRGVGPHEFSQVDVSSPKLRDVLRAFQPDTIVHLAFVVDPIHDLSRMRKINIQGTRNVCEAVRELRPRRFLTASSATAVGAWPDNQVPIEDHCSPRGRPEFPYTQDKTELEQIIGDFAALHADINVSWVRPCIVCGPGMNNYLRRMLLWSPAVFLLDGADVPMQFLHEDDFAAATYCVLKAEGRGPFNMAPPDWISMTEIARERRRFVIKIPLWAMQLHATISWNLRLPIFNFPAAVYYYLRYPWIVAPARLCGELGYQFKYSTLEALRDVLGKKTTPAESKQRVTVQEVRPSRNAA